MRYKLALPLPHPAGHRRQLAGRAAPLACSKTMASIWGSAWTPAVIKAGETIEPNLYASLTILHAGVLSRLPLKRHG